jgi:type II secretory pathway pseudopilin PulG
MSLLPRNITGFSLLEVILSGALVATLIGGLFAVASVSVRVNKRNQRQQTALLLADEGVAIARQIRDSNVTEPACVSECIDWRTGIVDLFATAPSVVAEALPVAKHIVSDETQGFRLSTIALTADNPCSDYIYYEGDRFIQTQNPPADKHDVYCRRLMIEPMLVSVKEGLAISTLRIRSQVTWLEEGTHAFQPLQLKESNPCLLGKNNGERCVESVTILTPRSQL